MTKIKCPICNSLQTENLFSVKDRFKISNQDFSLIKCPDCEINFTFPILDQEEIKKFYPKVYSWKKEYKTPGCFTNFFRKLEERYVYHLLMYDTKCLLETIKERGEILDIGCGIGSRLEIFREMGFKKFSGIEPSDEAIYAKQIKKLPVKKESLNECNFQENSFNIITLYHVFEHLQDPISSLKIIKKVLKPKGWLVLQIPNFGSYQAKFFKNKWFALDAPRHYFHYAPKTISQILLQNNFEVKKIDQNTNFLHPVYWVLSSFLFLDPQSIWGKEEKGQSKIFYRILWIFFTLLSIPLAKLENFLGKGGNMTIYAINKK